MSENSPSLARLRADLHRAAEIADLAQRTLEVVAVIEEAAMPLGIHPTIVGGMAVYFWTEGDAFVTYDIDVIMAVPEKLAEILAQLGFLRSKDGRHWELPDTEVLLEAPGADLDDGVQIVVVRLPSGRTARVLSRIDILLDRLDEFQTTGHQLVAQQALVLLAELTEAEQGDLDARAPARRVTVIVDAMRRLARELPSRSEPPASDELHEIARGQCVPSTLQDSHEAADDQLRGVAPRRAPPPCADARDPRAPRTDQTRQTASSNRGRVPAPHRHARAAHRPGRLTAAAAPRRPALTHAGRLSNDGIKAEAPTRRS